MPGSDVVAPVPSGGVVPPVAGGGVPENRGEPVVPDSWFAEPVGQGQPQPQRREEGPRAPVVQPLSAPPSQAQMAPYAPPPPPGRQYVPEQPQGGWAGAGRDERPLWDPEGPLPMTRSHRSSSGTPTRRGNKRLLAGVVALVALAVAAVLFVVFDGDDENTTVGPQKTNTPVAEGAAADPGAAKQAKRVNALLNSSSRSRTQLGGALENAKKCKKLPEAIASMQQIAQQRQQQLQRAETIKIGKLAQSGKLRTSLVQSMQLSLDVDNAFLAWANRHQGCKGNTPTDDPDYARGNDLSAQASKAKSRFLSVWNKVAPAHGLARRQHF
ncbi:hypothetical protein LO762_14300 [Actinocorallia sp. API 0066]|nr:hypothetical protein [Actinocorallia sp. API 0066]